MNLFVKGFGLALMLGLSASVPAFAGGPIENLDTGEIFATIQDALDDTDTLNGHVIAVDPGTYVENITISKNIKLYSLSGRAATTLQGISNVGAVGSVRLASGSNGVEIGAPGQGFTIIGIDNGAPGVENAAIYFQGSHTNAKVVDNEIVAQGDHGLLTEFGAVNTGHEISSNEFSGQTFEGPNPGGEGFTQQFTLPNVPRQLVTIGRTNTTDITFTNNTITGTAGGLNIDGDEQGNTLVTIDADDSTISGNTFQGTTTRFGTSLRCREPNTSITGNVFDSSGLSTFNGHVYLENIGSTTGAVALANTFDTGVYVDTPVGTIGHLIAPFAAGVPDGTTIDVLPGTYVEQIVFDSKSNVTLQGSGVGATLIHAPATLATIFTTSSPNKPILTVMNGTGVEVRDVSVDGLGVGNANNRLFGVAYRNAGGALLDSEIVDIRDTPASGVQHGVGIFAFTDDGGPDALEIGNVSLSGFQKNGMALSGTGLTVDVHDCTVTGAGYIDYTAQNGIQVGFGAAGTVTGNAVSDIFYDVNSVFAAAGILVFSSPSTDILGENVVTGSQEGVLWQDADGTIDGLEVTMGPPAAESLFNDGMFVANSTTSRSARATSRAAVPSPFGEGPAARQARASNTVTVSNSCLTGNGASGSAGIYGFSSGEPLDLFVDNVTISTFDYGMVADGASVAFDANDNSISGSGTAAFDNSLSGGPQQAELNWWGAADGPSGAGPGSGDAIDETGFPGSVDFDPFRTDGTSTTSCAFTPAGNNDVTIVPPSGVQCPDDCLTVSFDVARSDNAEMRGFSVTFELSELELCDGLNSIVEGTYLNAIGSTNCQRLDNTGLSYTFDCAILGEPCGQDAATGTLFTIGVRSTSAVGATGTVTLTDVTFRDCDNATIVSTAGAPADIPMDAVPPAAVGDLAATQIKTGNDTDGTTGIQIDFTAPGDAATVEVYRAGFGNYPEYDDAPGSGSVPAVPAYPPGPPWVLTGVGTSGDIDEVTERDFWYYVAFAIDACGNVSDVSNMTGGTLNYHLGDVTDGATPGTGDNAVDGLDISALGASYGATLGANDPVNYLDVGPTADFSPNTLPTTDNEVQFEDLIIFAINFGQVSVAPGGDDMMARAGDAHLELEVTRSVARELTASLVLRGANASIVKGTHAIVAYETGGLRLIDVAPGALASGGDVFLGTIAERGGVAVDLAVLGTGLTFNGEGVLAELRFAVSTPGAEPRLGTTILRDATNGTVSTSVAVDPGGGAATIARVELGARPNPFGVSTDLLVDLPAATDGALRIYDVYGRLVETLAGGRFERGRHVVSWNGRGADGRFAAPGVYFYAFSGDEHHETHKLLKTE